MASTAIAAWDEKVVDTRTGALPPKPLEPSELDNLRNSIGSKFQSLAALIGAAAAPVPNTGDGSKILPEEDTSLLKKIEGTLRDMSHLRIENIQTLIKSQEMKMTGELTDDKTYFMEGLVRTAATLPDGSKLRDTVTHKFLEQLWNDLEHPPQSYLGSKYQYRSADGSNNSLVHPQLGAAGTPYARTVKPTVMQTPARPDPGVVFDSIMTRKHADLHPNRISSMLFYLASIIIHDLFRTSHEDYSISMTSSYLDLSPLYGSNKAEQDMMRTRSDGKIKPDCFSEARLLFFPPGVGALLIMFNRFHNYVVENLALVNECNRFARPSAPQTSGDEEKDKAADAKFEKAKGKYDEDLFQTGRLITCGLYVNIILVDYVRTILDLNRTDSNWQLNPRANMEGVAIGVGNQVSAEFNLVYRWHSTVSDRDEKWTQNMWDELFGKGRDPKSVDKNEFLRRMGEVYRKTDPDPSKRSFAGLSRENDGTLPDQPLVDMLVSSVDDCANAFGPNRVPAVFRAIEVLGIEQARAWNLGSLNEFRKHFDLEPHNTFQDITSDKYVQEQLKHLYDHPDKVEIYPGLVAEDAKKPMAPGSGLCPGYTTSRAVLSDAVALVRGDRFYTKDYNPRTLTNWGYRLVDTDTEVDHGCVFYKLFLHAFPKHFKPNSVYIHYPMTVSSFMREALKDLKKDKLYDFSKPVAYTKPHIVKEHSLAVQILKDTRTFVPVPNPALESILGTSSADFKLPSTLPLSPDLETEIRTFYTTTTRSLLASKSALIASFHQVDIVRDIGNLVPLHFVSQLFMLPLKTPAQPRGIFTEAEMHLVLSTLASYLCVAPDPTSLIPVHAAARKPTQVLGALVEANVDAIARGSWLSSVANAIWPDASPLKDHGMRIIQHLAATSSDRLVWPEILASAAATVSLQSELFAQVLEFYVQGEGKAFWGDVQSLARADGDAAFAKLERYVAEGVRLAGEVAIERTVATPTASFTPGEAIFVDLRAASHDPSVFPDPFAVRLDRPMEAYLHVSPSEAQTRIALTAMLKEVARLKGLRPAAGPQGEIHNVVAKMEGEQAEGLEYHKYLTEMQDVYFGAPCCKFSLVGSGKRMANLCVAWKVCWDE
jgi:hypothetical protein